MHTSKSSIHRETPEIVLKSIFQRYDVDGNGTLDEMEFAKALEDLGIIDHTEQKALFALADSHNNKSVHYSDFLNLIREDDFESILASPSDYQFVIETYQAFQQYDNDGDGEVTWDEFYFYLTKHGYSHAYISQYWYYMNQSNQSTISFEGFWRGFKVQHQASSARTLQRQINEQITNKKPTKRKKKFNKTLNRPSFKKLVRNNSWNNNDKNNVFNYLKRHLTPSKHLRNRSPFALKLGTVLPDATHLKSSYSLCNVSIPPDMTNEDEDMPSAKPQLTQSMSVINRHNHRNITLDLSRASNSFNDPHVLVLNEIDELDEEMEDYPPITPELVAHCQSEVIVRKDKNVSADHETDDRENMSKKKKKKKKKKGRKKRKQSKRKRKKKVSVNADDPIDRRSVLLPSVKKKKSSHKTVKSTMCN